MSALWYILGFLAIPALFLPFALADMRRDKKREYQKQFCPTCRAEFTSQAWQDDLSAPYRQRIVKKRYCPNGHSWAVATSGVAGQESVMDRLGGWLP